MKMLKKSGLLSSCCTLQSHPQAYSRSSTSPPSTPKRRAKSSASATATVSTTREYAQSHRHREPDAHDNNQTDWPTSSASASKKKTPTPYEIFELEKGEIYSKQRFYQLVKIYHPDRHGIPGNPCSRELSQGERLERYRLVVRAHEILSNPTKRRDYDDHGTGWVDFQRTTKRHSRGYYAKGSRTPYGQGKGYDNSPFANATWEDWERWYARETTTTTAESMRQSYAGNYINPNLFASLVVMMAVMTGIAQATRSGQYSGSIEERAHAFTEETSRFLNDRAEEQKRDSLDSEGRVKWFLEKRDPSKGGLKDSEEDIYKDHFLPRAPSPCKDSHPSLPAD